MGRKVVVVNMDPANEEMPYPCAVDISELITLDEVMDSLKLGPNGGLLYCMQYLEANLDWLESKLKRHGDCYFLFDCPGQVELYTHQSSVKNIFSQLGKWNFRVRCLHIQIFLTENQLFSLTLDLNAVVSILSADSSAHCGLPLLR